MSLRQVRRSKDITQEQLAELSGIDQRNISDIERGKNRNPAWRTVAMLSRALNCDPFELFPVAFDAAEPQLPFIRDRRRGDRRREQVPA